MSKKTKVKKKRYMPPLTERQAWKIVARMFEGRSGLCSVVWWLKGAGLISQSVVEKMQNRIDKGRPAYRDPAARGGYYWPLLEVPYDHARVDFAHDRAKKAR